MTKSSTKHKRTHLVKVGEKYKNNEGYVARVVSIPCKDALCAIVFDTDSTNTEILVQMGNLRRGTFSNPFHRSICDVGYFGVGKWVAKVDGKHTEEYKHFSSMMKRCYSESRLKHTSSYLFTEVHPEMHCFQDVAEWCNNQIGFGNKGWQLDKDLLVRGNNEYSFDKCVFLPRQINTFITSKRNNNQLPIGVDMSASKSKPYRAQGSWLGENYVIGNFQTVEEAFFAYKKDKEANAKRLALLWKDYIDHRAYDALKNYTVSIED